MKRTKLTNFILKNLRWTGIFLYDPIYLGRLNRILNHIKYNIEDIEIISNKNKIAICLMLSVIFYGCDPQPQNGSSETNNGDFVTKVIDSCEYIEYDYGIFDQRVYSLTHKGNCKFCTERNKK